MPSVNMMGNGQSGVSYQPHYEAPPVVVPKAPVQGLITLPKDEPKDNGPMTPERKIEVPPVTAPMATAPPAPMTPPPAPMTTPPTATAPMLPAPPAIGPVVPPPPKKG
jgi:hypothetical protein